MRGILPFLLALAFAWPARGEVFLFQAPSGAAARELTIYSTLDEGLAAPMIEAFQARYPDVAVRYEDLLTGQIRDRVRDETDGGGVTADFVFSSGMDLQMSLANDGYALAVRPEAARDWPDWAQWQDRAYALTFEPAVLVYHRPSFPDGPPQSRLALMDWLKAQPAGAGGAVGTYDITRSALGYLFLARDEERFADIWTLVGAMARAGLEVFPTSQDIIDRVADGRLKIGYNILGSYAADQARQRPEIGLVLLKDFTVVVSRVALVPRAARNPDLGEAFLGFLMSREGQEVLARKLRLPAVSLEVSDGNSARMMQAVLGAQLQPVGVSPGLLVYLDQAKRRRLLARWEEALTGR
ncbi:iron ABC transporter [Tabrizicola sp. TH137]|uniref:ABC transporter substrate-binding protein n=1 Tax=Tabrizicola sp. TH137 TaxID=2067452 RepID=UPI000C7A7E6E|nr:ABC transporter substrate-binding protein [Tabrizicola sp. TH137]PLL11243.1 iron ABC transporter [Tabrizicola sp. TH137]